jgi:hypothetical protein
MTDRRPALFCKLGDLVEFVSDVFTTPKDDEAPLEISKGARYRAVGLVEFGWDLRRESGVGPVDVRVLNSQMARYVVVVESPVDAVLAATQIYERISANPAVVLERIARGGGSTNWYYCRNRADLDVVTGRLTPGCVVTFYFDDQLQRSPMSAQLATEIENIIAETGDAVVGFLGEHAVRLTSEVVVSRDDLAEFMASVPPATELFYGASPGRDDDGTRAITVTLPDADGIVRRHPH